MCCQLVSRVKFLHFILDCDSIKGSYLFHCHHISLRMMPLWVFCILSTEANRQGLRADFLIWHSRVGPVAACGNQLLVSATLSRTDQWSRILLLDDCKIKLLILTIVWRNQPCSWYGMVQYLKATNFSKLTVLLAAMVFPQSSTHRHNLMCAPFCYVCVVYNVTTLCN